MWDGISFNTDETKKYAQTIRTHSDEQTYTAYDVTKLVSDDLGDTKNELYQVASDTFIWLSCTKQVMQLTAGFLSKAAEVFEKNDNAMAREIDIS